MPQDRSIASLNNARIGGAEWDVAGRLNVNAGGVLQIEPGGLFLESVAEGLTATAGGTQAAALQLTAMMTRVTTVASAGDSVRLVPAVAGLTITLINAGANAMQVFGFGTDTVNGVATATGVSMPVGKTADFNSTLAGTWHMKLSA